MNNVILVGRTTADIQLKKGKKDTFCQFSLAVDGVNKTDFINCVAFGKIAEVLEKYVKKGNKVAVSGSLNTRDYTDKKGVKHYVTEAFVRTVDFMESARANKEDSDNTLDISSEDLPF